MWANVGQTQPVFFKASVLNPPSVADLPPANQRIETFRRCMANALCYDILIAGNCVFFLPPGDQALIRWIHPVSLIWPGPFHQQDILAWPHIVSPFPICPDIWKGQIKQGFSNSHQSPRCSAVHDDISTKVLALELLEGITWGVELPW